VLVTALGGGRPAQLVAATTLLTDILHRQIQNRRSWVPNATSQIERNWVVHPNFKAARIR
jgi:hypothetical protein